MASVLAGFQPVKHLNGSPYNGAVNRYTVPAAETGAINVGDLVILSDSSSGTKYPAVERASGTTAVVPVGVVCAIGLIVTNVLPPPRYSGLCSRASGDVTPQ